MVDCEPQIATLLRKWRVNRSFYWRWGDNYDAELVERGLLTIFRSAKWRQRLEALADMRGLAVSSEEHAMLRDATQIIAELLGASAGMGKITVRTRA